MIDFKSFFKSSGNEGKPNLSKDPVCGMNAQKTISLNYQGTVYSFCSDNCKQQFEESPESYIRK